MPKITITSLEKEIFCASQNQTLLAAIHQNGIDWMHACGGKGRCTTCAALVVSGHENINERTKNELYYLKNSGLGKDERLACQSTISGDIEVSVPIRNKLPHLNYLD